jgi:hypothetical protein
MQIEVTPGVFWDTEKTQQSPEAVEWLQAEVRPNLSELTLDAHKRPDTRTYENTVVVVVEKQSYFNESSDWARRGVEYIVTEKGGENETV